MLSIKKHDLVIKSRLEYYSLFGKSLYQGTSTDNLNRYLSKAVKKEGDFLAIPVTYEVGDSGRLCSTSGACLQYFPKDIRNWLIPDGAVDVDIVNAAPTILAQVGDKHGLDLPNLKEFADNTKAYLNQFNGGTKTSQLKGKILFADPNTAITTDDTIRIWLDLVRSDLHKLYQATVNMATYASLKESVDTAIIELKEAEKDEESKKKKRKTEDGSSQGKPMEHYNHQGKFLSRLYFYWETKIIKTMLEAADEEGYFESKYTSLIYDGMVVYPRRGSRIEDTIVHLENAVMMDHDIAIKLQCKPIVTNITQDIDEKPEEIIVESDDQAARIMAFILGDSVKKIGDASLVAKSASGLWYGGSGFDKKNPAMGHIRNQLALANMKTIRLFNGAEKEVPYSVQSTYQDHAITCLLPKLPMDKYFMRNIVLESRRKLRFMNGYYEFQDSIDEKTGYYGTFYEDAHMDSMVEVPQDFPPFVQEDVDFVIQNVLLPIFDNTEDGLLESFLCDIARCLAGHADKSTIMMTGTRNCGKSVIGQFITTIFGPYVSTLPASILGYRSTSGDGLTENKWVCGIENTRIGIVSEGKEAEAGSGVQFSGETMKQVQSLKEGVMARQIYCEQRKYYSLMSVLLLMNEVPKMDVEAVKNVRIYKIATKFVTKEDKKAMPFITEFKLRNEEVEAWSQSSKFKNLQDAFLHIIFRAYRPQQQPPLESMIGAISDIVSEDPMTLAIDAKLEITGCYEDFVPIADTKNAIRSMYKSVDTKIQEFNQTLYTKVMQARKENGLNDIRTTFMSKDKFSRGVKRIGNKTHKVYYGIRFKESQFGNPNAGDQYNHALWAN